MSEHSFAFQKALDRLDQVETKLQLVVTEVIKLRNEVRVLLGRPRPTVIDFDRESYTVTPIETESQENQP
jgi:hypothetical protein